MVAKVPTTYTDQFFVIDPGNPPANGTALTVQKFDLVDGNDNGFINPNDVGDTVNGADVTSAWVNDTITVVMNGVQQTITGTTFYLNGQPAVFTPTDGTVLSDATFVSSTFVTTSTQMPVSSLGPPCFVAGTLIDTPDGPKPVESLMPGDLVLTLDDGPQEVLWCGSRLVAGKGRLAPICFAPGALGNDRPLLVSPQHRMLVSGPRAELLFGDSEVLVAAKHLVDGDRIYAKPMDEVVYVHILFRRHQVVFAEGVASESFFPGDVAVSGDRALRDELAVLFPELLRGGIGTGFSTARRVATGAEAWVLRAA